MEKLPTEVIREIFELLSFNDFYQCALACRGLLTAAQSYLYRYISIKEKAKARKFFYTIANLNPSLGNSLVILKLLRFPVEGFDLENIFGMFPNLTTLEIAYPDSLVSFTHQLKNMPSLTYLNLEFMPLNFDIDDMEVLHQNIPSLVYLKLDGPVLPTAGLFAKTVEPNTTLESIHLDFHCKEASPAIADTYIQFLQYARLKYSSIQVISLFYEDYDQFTVNEQTNIFDQGWFPLLQSRGPQLQYIQHLGVKPNVNIFTILDNCGCKPYYLEMRCAGGNIDINQLARSNQRHTLRELYVLNAFHSHTVSLTETKLEKLYLHYTLTGRPGFPETIFLDRLLRLCPDTLDDLDLSFVIINADLNEEEEDQFRSSLTKLNVVFIGDVPVDRESVYQKAERMCPNVKKIGLYEI